MQIYLNEFAVSYQDNRLIIIMDNAGWHTSKNLEIPQNMVVWNIPPYSPELNPAEHIWNYIRQDKKFNNHVFKSLEEVDTKLTDALSELQNEKETIRDLTNFYWIYP